MHTLGFIGGTGPLGRGLALRLAIAGNACVLGSRDPDRAGEAAAKTRGKALEAIALHGATNSEAASGADIAFVTVPYAAQAETVGKLRAELAGKVVVNCVNALGFDERGPYPLPVDAGSAGEECQELLPDSWVVGAFQNISAVMLLRPDTALESDIFVVGDDASARERVGELAAQIPNLRTVDVGPLRLAKPVEDITSVLIAVNKSRKAHTGLRMTGLEESPDPPTGAGS